MFEGFFFAETKLKPYANVWRVTSKWLLFSEEFLSEIAICGQQLLYIEWFGVQTICSVRFLYLVCDHMVRFSAVSLLNVEKIIIKCMINSKVIFMTDHMLCAIIDHLLLVFSLSFNKSTFMFCFFFFLNRNQNDYFFNFYCITVAGEKVQFVVDLISPFVY